MQRVDEGVQRGPRSLGYYFDAPTVWQVSDVAAESQSLTGAGDEVAEADTLHAAADGCVQVLGAFGLRLHVRGARPVRSTRGAVRG